MIVEPIDGHRRELGVLLSEAQTAARDRFGPRAGQAVLKKWKSLIEQGTGFVLLDGSRCEGLLLYSAEYEFGLSSFLSDASAQRLPHSATISACYVLEEARDGIAANEGMLLRGAVSELRAMKSIETIAVQISPRLYEISLEGKLARMGFMNCERVRMERPLTGRIAKAGAPRGCRLDAPTDKDIDDLRSIIYQGYFSEIDGYLFPDIAVVCSDPSLFREFLRGGGITLDSSVIARVRGYPSGCIITLSDKTSRCGLIGVVAVLPGMRRRGIARAMIGEVVRKFRDKGYVRAALAVTIENQPALALYRSLGFEEAAPRARISVWRRSVSRPLMIFSR